MYFIHTTFENVIWTFHHYVSAKNMSTVVMSVLQTLGKFKVDEAELPKQPFSKLNFQKANLVSSRQVTEEQHVSVNSTVQSDGTSCNGEKVVVEYCQMLCQTGTHYQRKRRRTSPV